MKYQINCEWGTLPKLLNTYEEAIEYLLYIKSLNKLIGITDQRLTIVYSVNNSTARAI